MKRLGARARVMQSGAPTWRSLQDAVLRFRDARDWKQFHNPKDLAAAVAIEAGELQELFLWRSEAEVGALLGDRAKRGAAQDELADVFICALLCADALGADVDTIIRAKLRKNALKYPVGKSRGSSRKYTELERS